MFNKLDTIDKNGFGKYLDIVGNGTDKDHRSNAYTLSKEGVGWFARGIKVGGSQESEGTDVSLIEKLFGDEIDNKHTSVNGCTNLCLYEANGYKNAPFEKCFILYQDKDLGKDSNGDDMFEYSQFAFDFNSLSIAKRQGQLHSGDYRTEEWSYFENNNNLEVDIATPETAGIVKPSQELTIDEQGTLGLNKTIQIYYDEIDKLEPYYANIPLIMSYDSRKIGDEDLHYHKAPFSSCSIITLFQDWGYEVGAPYGSYNYYQIASDGFRIKVRFASGDDSLPGEDLSKEGYTQFYNAEWIEIPNIRQVENKINVLKQQITGNGYMEINPQPIKNEFLTLNNGQIARIGNNSIANFTILIPENIDFTNNSIIYNSAFTLHCGDIPPTLAYAGEPIRWAGDDVSYDGIFTPQANTIYEVWVTFVDVDKEGNPIISARVGIV